ncbi:hypothetical protein LTR40_011429, partial [Exophiala xenobiotica]
CMTCKKKRLKCDETKPSCAQCQKRNVVCEGYKKDYKWRTFEETTFNAKPATKKKAFRSNSFAVNHHGAQPLNIAGAGRADARHSGFEEAQPANTWSPGLHTAFTTATHAFQDQMQRQSTLSSPERQADFRPDTDRSPHLNQSPGSVFMPAFDSEDISPGLTFGEHMDRYNFHASLSATENNSARSFSSGSPQLLDLLLPGTDLNQPPDPSELRPPMSPLPYQPDASVKGDDDFDEEILRSDAMGNTTGMPATPLGPHALSWQAFRASSPTPSEGSSSSSKSSELTILARPSLDASSPEMLMLRFDKQTCGILSVKDGPTENPWRTLIWPLARESPALYHAISSMTAFHGAHEDPLLHTPGMAHMTKSIKRLA